MYEYDDEKMEAFEEKTHSFGTTTATTVLYHNNSQRQTEYNLSYFVRSAGPTLSMVSRSVIPLHHQKLVYSSREKLG